MAPKTAAYIRSVINPDPRLNRTVNFNVAAPLGGAVPI
jgi:hypothetical protein